MCGKLNDYYLKWLGQEFDDLIISDSQTFSFFFYLHSFFHRSRHVVLGPVSLKGVRYDET